MLISFAVINEILKSNNIHIIGGFHLGAHECEELGFYRELGLKFEEIIWIDAIPAKVTEAINRNIPNVYNALITDCDDLDVTFNVSNNIQSSSVLELGTHAQEHPEVAYVDKICMKSITVDSFFERNNIDASKYNFWNFDIQGAENLANFKAIQVAAGTHTLHIQYYK